MARHSKLTRSLLVTAFLVGCSGGDRSSAGDARSEPATVTGAQASPNASDDRASDDSESVDGPRVQTSEEALEADLALIAESQGWTVEQARESHRRSEVTGAISEQIYEQRREVYVGGAVGPGFDDAPRLYIKGEADAFVRGLVAEAPFEILIIDRQPYSFDENDARVSLLMSELLRLGFDNAAAAADITRESVIEASVMRAPGAPDSVEAILASLPSELQTGVELELSDVPVAGYE